MKSRMWMSNRRRKREVYQSDLSRKWKWHPGTLPPGHGGELNRGSIYRASLGLTKKGRGLWWDPSHMVQRLRIVESEITYLVRDLGSQLVRNSGILWPSMGFFSCWCWRQHYPEWADHLLWVFCDQGFWLSVLLGTCWPPNSRDDLAVT